MKLNLYEIRLLKREEYDKFIEFIRCYWSENHIFCNNRQVFEFQHGVAENGEYDFIVAVHKESREIHAVLGYISTARYDSKYNVPQAVYGALWKVRDDVSNNEIGKLGLGVLYYLIKKFPDTVYITLGLSEYSQRIYEALHFYLGIMNHYYIANPKLKNYVIAKKPIMRLDVVSREDVELRILEEIPEITNTFYPDKSRDYIQNRYLNHPIYQYKLLGIFINNNIKCIWVVRRITVEGHICIRLVDMMGSMEELTQIGSYVQNFLEQNQAEYIDCYNYGIAKEQFINAGFHMVDGDTIIPNYFEPFEKKNVEIHYAFTGEKPVVIFKADADQDRPNI